MRGAEPMPTDHRAALARIKRFDQLIAYLRDEMGWPIARESFEEVDDLFYDFTADELGIDPKTAAKIESIKRLRPLSPNQPWGIFFIKFEPKKLPVVALRRILSRVALRKRASANNVARWRESWRSAFTLRHGEVINTSKVLAVRLAELARAIRDRIKSSLAIES